jgi:glutamate synthase domain-containing protein 3
MSQPVQFDAQGVYYRDLNKEIREAVSAGATEVELLNVKGQRYIATGLSGELKFTVHGTPGQDLAAFMKGPRIVVHGNAQDGVGNTMDEGSIIIHGLSGDVLGYAMRGGRIMVRGDVGYRVGIHMKAFEHKNPVIIIGGKAGDFLGEYMAGGIILLLGLFSRKPYAPICGRSLGTGMHGGVIYVRGEVPIENLGPGLTAEPVDDMERRKISELVAEFAAEFDENPERILDADFYRVKPFSHRPFKKMYVPA